jgi:hypothetical protein
MEIRGSAFIRPWKQNHLQKSIEHGVVREVNANQWLGTEMMRSHEVPDEVSEVVDWASRDVYHGQDSGAWSPYRLDEPLLTVWAVEQAQGIIDNGGFQYFFENDWPENPEYSVFVDSFRRIGAAEAADCIQDAASMFPSSTPQLDCEMRREHMDFLRQKEGTEESVLDKLGFRVMDLGGDTMIRLAAYVRVHIEHFPTARKNAEPDASP